MMSIRSKARRISRTEPSPLPRLHAVSTMSRASSLVDFRTDRLVLFHYAGDGDKSRSGLAAGERAPNCCRLRARHRGRLEPVPEHADRSLRPRRGRCDQRVSLGSSSKPAIGDLVWACCPQPTEQQTFFFFRTSCKRKDIVILFRTKATSPRAAMVPPSSKVWQMESADTSSGSTTLDFLQNAGERMAIYLRSLR